MHSNLKYWIWLTVAYGPCNPAKWNFLSHYDSVKSAYDAVQSNDMRYVLPKDKKSVLAASLDYADKLLELINKNGISICCFEDEEYPNILREIYNPPALLFYRGDISLIDKSLVISCVGTRKPSDYSLKVCTKICSDLVKAGVVIASGFQLGLDSFSHNIALQNGGKTIAVLPCGMLYDYPKENAKAKNVIAKRGLLITELFPNDRPNPGNFRARNRILSGIGVGTLILQAGAKSGSLSTANYALSQGKDIFCIPPHELFNDEYAGVINLIRDGAIPVFDANDVLNEYYSVYSHKLNPNMQKNPAKSESGIFSKSEKQEPTKKPTDAKPKPSAEEKAQPVKNEPSEHKQSPAPESPAAKNHSKQLIDTTALTEEQLLVYDYLADNGAVHMDTLAAELSDKVDDIESLVTDMELEGILRSLSGNRFTI